MYKPSDAINLGKSIEILLKTALEDTLKRPIHMRILSNEIMHDQLQPEGEVFQFKIRVEVHPRKEEKPK